MRQRMFQLLDVSGRIWTVPAELVETKLTSHVFVVHKSLDLNDNLWIVSHEETGGKVGDGDTKEAAIADAVKRINAMSVKKFEVSLRALKAERKALATTQTSRPG